MGKELKYWIVFTVILLGSSIFVYEFFVKGQYSNKTKPVKVIQADGSVLQSPPTALKVSVLKDRHILILAQKDVDKNGFIDQVLVTADRNDPYRGLQVDFITYDTKIHKYIVADSVASTINTYRNLEYRYLAEYSMFILWGKNTDGKYFLEYYQIVKDDNLLSMRLKSVFESDVLPQFLEATDSINFDSDTPINGTGFIIYRRQKDNLASYDKKFFIFENGDFNENKAGTEIFFDTYLDASQASGPLLVRDSPMWLDGIWERTDDSTIDLFKIDAGEGQITLMRDHLLETYIEKDRPLSSDTSVYIRAQNENVNTIVADFILTKTGEEKADVKIIWAHDEETVSIKKVAKSEYETKFGLISNQYTDYSSLCKGVYDDIALESRVIFLENGFLQEIISNNVDNGRYICYKWNDYFILEIEFNRKNGKKVYQVIDETTEANAKALWLLPIKITSNGISYLGERNKYLVEITEAQQ